MFCRTEIIKFSAFWRVQTDMHGSVTAAYLARSHSRGLGACLHRVTITPFYSASAFTNVLIST